MVTAPSCLRQHRAPIWPLRGYRSTIPATLQASRGYPAALIAAYGVATETVPGGTAIADDAVMGVHITRLLPDGSWRDRGDDAKITDRPLSRVADRAGVVQRSAWIDDR